MISSLLPAVVNALHRSLSKVVRNGGKIVRLMPLHFYKIGIYVCINNNKSTESIIILAKGANIHIAHMNFLMVCFFCSHLFPFFFFFCFLLSLTSSHCLNFIAHILITEIKNRCEKGKKKH